jgi:hypothetical protein
VSTSVVFGMAGGGTTSGKEPASWIGCRPRPRPRPLDGCDDAMKTIAKEQSEQSIKIYINLQQWVFSQDSILFCSVLLPYLQKCRI